jgi:hypothetical protein
MPLNPEDKLAMELTVAKWNVVLQMMQKGPYDVVAPIIAEMMEQAKRRQMANGEDSKKEFEVQPIRPVTEGHRASRQKAGELLQPPPPNT